MPTNAFSNNAARNRELKRGQTGAAGGGTGGTVTPVPPTGNVTPTAPVAPASPADDYLRIADRLAQALGSPEGRVTATPTQTLAPASGPGIGGVLVLVLLVGGGVWFFMRKRGTK